ncbi:hypothetical protein [Streptomyces sp. NPDC058678]|uniref:hypothetical protein n=1 Tax=Streptomyces sp. NPDC058678 TaxID=3346595 RepID=UPI00364B8B6E
MVATAVFIDVLMLAVSDLASEDWDFRFAALLTLQDQNVMGRGAVGFDLAEFDWGATERERARAKDFVLRATALAASGHRWSELGYHPPRVHDYLHRFTTMVESCTPARRQQRRTRLPRPGRGRDGLVRAPPRPQRAPALGRLLPLQSAALLARLDST